MSNKNSGFGDKVFGDKIKWLREKKGWKQDGLADKAKLSQPEISKIENGFVRGGEETIQKLADAFEVPVKSLVINTSFAANFGIHPLFNTGNTNQSQPIVAYFASALTGLSDEQINEVAELDERVNTFCTEYSHYSVALYRPRLKTSPTGNPDVTPREVYDIDQERVASSDLVFLATIFPSLGAGMEIQLALQSCSSIILLKKKDQSLSRMVTGCPAVIEIVEYSSLAELDEKLAIAMDSLLPRIAELRLTNPQQQASFELGGRVRQLRIQRNYKEEQLARLVGVDTSYINSLESKPEHIINPSLEIIRRIAKALLTSESYLISGHHVDSVFDEHFHELQIFAEEVSMSVPEFNLLWQGHTQTYKNDLSMTGVKNRAKTGTKKYWKEQFEGLKEQKIKGGKLFD
jgi:transcriptional regulator with XRE-family HTH domain